MADDSVHVERLRAISMVLPEATEVELFGSPTFRVATTAFAVFEREQGAPVVRVKVDLDEQTVLLQREGFEATPETGAHGWTNIRLDLDVSWDDIDPLVIASYRLQAPKHLRAALDELLTAAGEEAEEEVEAPIDLEVLPSPADRRVVVVFELEGPAAQAVVDAELAWREATENERSSSRVIHAHTEGRHLLVVEYATAADAEHDRTLAATTELLAQLAELSGAMVAPRVFDIVQTDRR